MMHYTLFGESHGPAVGVLLTDVPPGLPLDEAFIREQLLRRMGQGGLTTARQEKEEVHFLSGVYRGRTTGDPLAAVIYNGDVRSADYDSLKNKPRPSHGDYTAAVRALGCNDPRGGGHTSGRLTAPLTVAGALAITYLKTAHIAVHADVLDEEALRARAAAAKADGDSVGGVIRCTVSGLPAGLGGPDWRDTVEGTIARHVFAIPAVKAIGFGAGETFAQMRGSAANDPFTMARGAVRTATNHAGGVNAGITNGMDVVFDVTFRPTPSIAKEQRTVDLYTVEGTIARHVFAIPAVKAIGFGAGETFAQMRGSAANDPFTMARGAVRTATNHAGGVNAGITNGMDVVFDVTFRPTPSIAKEQRTVDLYTMTETTISVSGRHDACIALRAAPAVESAAALAVCQLLPDTPADLDGLRCRLDETDAAILELFDRRQRLSAAIGAYKSAHGLPVRDKAREAEVLRTRGDMLPERRDQAERLMTLLMALSREEQA